MAAEARDPAGADASLKHLPAGRTLTDLLRAAEIQLEHRGLTPDSEDNYPALAVLWVRVHALARHNREETPQAAGVLLGGWAEMGRARGDPWAHDWRMLWSEAMQRYEMIVGYLTGVGSLDLDTSEPDSPKHYLTRKELQISEQ